MKFVIFRQALYIIYLEQRRHVICYFFLMRHPFLAFKIFKYECKNFLFIFSRCEKGPFFRFFLLTTFLGVNSISIIIFYILFPVIFHNFSLSSFIFFNYLFSSLYSHFYGIDLKDISTNRKRAHILLETNYLLLLFFSSKPSKKKKW